MKTPLKGIDACQIRMHENANDKSAERHVVLSFMLSLVYRSVSGMHGQSVFLVVKISRISLHSCGRSFSDPPSPLPSPARATKYVCVCDEMVRVRGR